MIDENNPVRAIDAIAESIGIPTLGFKYSETASTVRKPHSPVDQVVADKGYYSAKQFKKCKDDQIIPTVPKAIHNNAPDEAYSNEKFIYDEQDGYLCPEGQLLKLLKRRASSARAKEIFESVPICRACPVKKNVRKLHTDIFQSDLFSNMPMWLTNVRRKTKRWFGFASAWLSIHLVR